MKINLPMTTKNQTLQLKSVMSSSVSRNLSDKSDKEKQDYRENKENYESNKSLEKKSNFLNDAIKNISLSSKTPSLSTKNISKITPTSSSVKYSDKIHNEESIKNKPKIINSSKIADKQQKKIPIYDKNLLIKNKSLDDSLSINNECHPINLCKTSEKEVKVVEEIKKFTPMLEKVKISNSAFSSIEAYSAVTHQGNFRNYNEDRVSIIMNVSKPQTFNGDWPKCSFFGLYDGHAGSLCSDFLRDNLHKYIFNDNNFPNNPQKAILNGFLKAEDIFLKYCLANNCSSGSCAIIVIIIEKKCFVANVGDSRAIMSGSNGEKLYVLSRDHRPSDEKEYKRIIDAGGQIYQTESNIYSKDKNESIVGPLRVKPGKLSVSRTIGDIEAKLPQFKGNPNVIIGVPEIKYFELNDTYDFILIGCKYK